VKIIDDRDLPASWADAVYERATQQLGANLLSNPGILAFSIPSAVSKSERNVVLNPESIHFGELVKIDEETPFEFDSRLLKG
jgi:RES domain-containing protein